MVDNNENINNANNSLISKIKLTSPDFYDILGNKYILYHLQKKYYLQSKSVKKHMIIKCLSKKGI